MSAQRSAGPVRPSGAVAKRLLRSGIVTGRRRRPVLVLLVSAIVAAMTNSASSATRTRPIVVESYGLTTLDPVTGGVIQTLTTRRGREPRWSPDGARVAFGDGYENRLEIWIVRADGSSRTRLTHNDKLDQWPSWAPDSRRLAVERYDVERRSYDSEIFIVRADGSRERNLTKNDVDDRCPDWSSAGKVIAFYREPELDIYTIRADGRRLRQLTSGPQGDVAPKWSPDGRRILFTRITYSRDLLWGPISREDLFVMDRDGSNLRQLTDTELIEEFYSWSPDGNKIAFLRTPDFRSDTLWVMDADGSGARELVTNGVYANSSPTWSRNSRKIVYLRHTEEGDEERYDVWSVRADGTHNHVLRRSFVHEDSPDWYSAPQECRDAY